MYREQQPNNNKGANMNQVSTFTKETIETLMDFRQSRNPNSPELTNRIPTRHNVVFEAFYRPEIIALWSLEDQIEAAAEECIRKLNSEDLLIMIEAGKNRLGALGVGKADRSKSITVNPTAWNNLSAPRHYFYTVSHSTRWNNTFYIELYL
jgi:hypothetical protein